MEVDALPFLFNVQVSPFCFLFPALQPPGKGKQSNAHWTWQLTSVYVSLGCRQGRLVVREQLNRTRKSHQRQSLPTLRSQASCFCCLFHGKGELDSPGLEDSTFSVKVLCSMCYKYDTSERLFLSKEIYTSEDYLG